MKIPWKTTAEKEYGTRAAYDRTLLENVDADSVCSIQLVIIFSIRIAHNRLTIARAVSRANFNRILTRTRDAPGVAPGSPNNHNRSFAQDCRLRASLAVKTKLNPGASTL